MRIIIERHNHDDLGRPLLPAFVNNVTQPGDVEGSERRAHCRCPDRSERPAPSVARHVPVAAALSAPCGEKIEGGRSANSGFRARIFGMLRGPTNEAGSTRDSPI